MARGCRALDLIPPAPGEAAEAAAAALAAAGLEGARAAVRLTLTAGSGRGLDRPADAETRLIATASPAPSPEGPIRLRTASVRRNDQSPASRLKTLSYLDNVLARRQARAQGADEAIMLNTRGEIACAAAANLFWIAEGRLCTPALACGVLDGIVRAQAIGAAAALGVGAAEVRAGPPALEAAEAAFVTNSLAGVRAVSEIDGRALQASALVDAISSRCR
ncbi:MAG: aminotransferase class IV [Caulobacteraceae bacterium]